ncbi:DUF4175 domain-containing protein [Paracoccus caeni]|uniref:DUF4175 domain-containing protein n=2 Tax=Paracoccus caeni TaxID=657651 RepID=A0A934VYG8_9RHOB|nr:DUF4175 domain-containing protein [Paracoccus caeni]
MEWERAARAFWPLATMLAVLFAVVWLNLVEEISPELLPWVTGAALILLVVTAIRGGLRYRRVRRREVVERLDRTLPGRPLAALSDRAAIGGEGALWQAHLAQMSRSAAQARAVKPDAGLSRRDPFALRLAGLVALVMALIFGGISDMDRGLSAIAATANRPGTGDAKPIGPSWEGWAEPPAYTRRPTIYLNAQPEGELLELPKGTTLSFRLYDDSTGVSQDIGTAIAADDPKAPTFRAEESGVISVGDRRFEVTVLPDEVPVIRAGAAPVRRADGRMVQDYEAEDDHGVMAATATISLDLPQIDRRYGLAADPEPRADVELALPIPRRADRRDISGQLVQDLSRHPWANLPVTLTLTATDGIEQTGTAEPMQTILPGRRFFQPLAAALIEMRRDLLWSRENADRSAEILRAVTWQPEGFVDQQLYLQLRGAVTILESGEISEKARDEMAEALWQAAIQLEDGGLADALQRMRQAQEKLSEAIRNGASPDEIQRLMDELKEATDAYTRMLAEQNERDPSERFTRDQERQMITGDQIQEMMDEIQRLMNEGRMAEAQELLEQFNRMMENLQVTQGDGDGDGIEMPGQGGAMGRLADSLREQQRLSDDAFRDMQEQFGNGEMGQPSTNSDEMAERQRQLREELGQQRGLLPGQGSDSGDRAGDQLDEAGRAMEDAEQALRDGDMSGAMQRQADAIESMRESMRALGEMMQGQQGDQEGGAQEDPNGQRALDRNDRPGGNRRGGGQQGQPNRPITHDPLGRESAGADGNVQGGGEEIGGAMDPARRARDLLDEIRRRSAERQRPEDERDYLGRLLDRF